MIRQLLLNSFSSLLVPVVKIVITFIMAPVIVRSLGNYDYGVWEMVFAVVGYMGMLDMGLAPAIVRSVARQQALQDTQALRQVFSTALAFFFPVGLSMALLLVGAALFPEIIFKADINTDVQRYAIFLVIIAVQVLASFVGLVFDCFLEGFQRYTLRNGATVIASIAGALVLYPLLKNGGGLLTLAAANTIGFSLKIAYYGYVLGRPSGGKFSFRFNDVSRETFKELFSFGLKSFVYATSFSIGALTDKLIIGSFVGPIAVTFYTIPVNLLSQVRNLVWSVTRVFMPMFSELDAKDEKQAACDLLFVSSRYALGFILPIIVGICVLGPAFLHHWIGPEYSKEGRWVLYLMTMAYMLQWLCPFRNRFLQGVNRLDVQARLGVLSVVINLAVALVLVQFLGKEGVVLGAVISAMLIEPYLLAYTCRVAGGSVSRYCVSVFLPLLSPVAIFSFFLAWLAMAVPPQSLWGVIGFAALGMIIYCPLFTVFSMTRNERVRLWINIMTILRKKRWL